MQKAPQAGITASHRKLRWIRIGLSSIVLAGFATLANADVMVCNEQGKTMSLRVSFLASFENAIIVSDNNGQRLIGFNSFFGRGAGGEWAHGNGSWQAPQGPERRCYRISGQHKAGTEKSAGPWQASACRVIGNTIGYGDGNSFNDAQIEIFGGRIEAIDPPCRPASQTGTNETPEKRMSRAKPPMAASPPPPPAAPAAMRVPVTPSVPGLQTPTKARGGVAGESAKVEAPAGVGDTSAQPGMAFSFKLPEFPFPPPDPSARLRIPPGLLAGNAAAPSFGSVATRMETALASNGYTELGYFAVPGGFTLVTQIERINPDATPSAKQRWNIKVDPVSLKSFSIDAYVRALLQMDAGFFRVIVFVFSSEPFTASGKKVPVEQAIKWIDKGANTLPNDVAAQPYGTDMVGTALVYEFEIHTHGADARLRKPSPHDGTEHLRASGILRALGE